MILYHLEYAHESAPGDWIALGAPSSSSERRLDTLLLPDGIGMFRVRAENGDAELEDPDRYSDWSTLRRVRVVNEVTGGAGGRSARARIRGLMLLALRVGG